MDNNKKIRLLVSLILVVVISITNIILIAGINLTNAKKATIEIFEENKKINILDIQNDFNRYYIKCDKVKNANKYTLEVLSNDSMIASTSDENGNLDFTLPLDNLKYGDRYHLNISAYKNEDLLVSSVEDVFIVWSGASFSLDNATTINNTNYTLKIDGTLSEDYRLVIKNKDKTLYDELILENTFVVPTSLYKNKSIELDFMLYYDNVLTSYFKLTNKYEKPTTTTAKNPIKDIKISKPASYTSLTEVKDITVEFSGGDNSTEKYIYIYENNSVIKKELLTSNIYTIPASTFKNDSLYKIMIEATDGKFKKIEYVYISTIQNGGQKMVDLARTQLGVKQGLKYSKWYGFNGRVEWCAVFISWVANELGYLKTAVPKFANVGVGWRWFNSRGLAKKASSGYVPKTGDIIFFDFEANGRIDHVGIVDYSDGKYVYTIEGNSSGDECKAKKYKINYKGIHGYGTPQY